MVRCQFRTFLIRSGVWPGKCIRNCDGVIPA
jgi:hypothetical protein